MTQEVQRVPTRNQVSIEDTWDLESLYGSDDLWEKDFAKFEASIEGYARFRGKLSESVDELIACLEFDLQIDRLSERIGTYAFLRTTEDQANSSYQAMKARFQNVAVKASQLASFIRPEILAMDADTLKSFIDDPKMEAFRLILKRIARYKPHTLGANEERLLAMQGEMAQTASQVFRQLSDADLKFGTVDNGQGEQVELTNATLMSLLYSPNREVRKKSFHQYYDEFEAHQNTLAATLAGSVHGDVYYAKAREYKSSLEAALFPDNVPVSLYDNLIKAVREHLPSVHRYFDLRRRKMGLKDIHHYDTYVPIVADQQTSIGWDDAVTMVMDSLKPLGQEYCSALHKGLRGRWCDRYPNQGKQSGAFSCGTFDADPYILMNYKPTVLNDVFTLTHEAGHSMHSYYSAKHQPFQYYNYTIFVAEVASTFNEQLLAHHMIQQSSSSAQRAFLINHEVDSIRMTIVRQTMFAEFEKRTHEMAEAGEPLTVESIKQEYRKLLDAYFGPEFSIDDQLALECFRIPHFYRAFYVYKYATGLSAAIALSRRVLEGGQKELDDYLNFLKGGCSKDPLELLAGAGVDMASPEPVETALKHFGKLVEDLDQLLS